MSISTVNLYKQIPEDDQNYIESICRDFLINPQLSKESIAKDISEKTSLKVDRKSIVKIMNHLNLPDRDAEIVRQSKILIGKAKRSIMAEEDLNKIRNLFDSISNEELSKLINESSVTQVSQKFDTSIYYLTIILKERNIETRDIFTYKEIFELYQQKGFTKKDLKENYLDKNKSFNDFKSHISGVVGYNISDTSTYRLLKHLNILKSQDVIAFQQGKKSRKELLVNLEKLKKAGFDSRENLAKHYESNLSLTKRTLAEQLNNKIGENFFSVRWFGRHLDPFLSEDRLKGISRVEKEFQQELSKRFEKKNFSYNDRSLIKPYELDVVDGDSQIAIEFNGNYWHSDKFLLANHNMTSVEYHTMKELLCKDIGFTVLFIWEYDWENDSESILKAIDGYFKSGFISPLLSKKEYC